jgi:hypothetical protein
MDDSKDTILEVVRDDQGGAAWRECTPDGECTISRQRHARGRQVEAKRLALGQLWEASDDD